TRFSRDWSSDVCSSDLSIRISIRFENRSTFVHSRAVASVRERISGGPFSPGGSDRIPAPLRSDRVPVRWSLPKAFRLSRGFGERSEERRVGKESRAGGR